MSTWTPSIVPTDDQTVYFVMDDLGTHGRVWREAEAETTDLETVFTDLLTGQYNYPVRVVGFNTAEAWSRDVSEDVAHELRRRTCSFSNYPRASKTLSRGVRRAAGNNSPCAWYDQIQILQAGNSQSGTRQALTPPFAKATYSERWAESKVQMVYGANQ